jgi:hypothetical protein
MRRPELFVEREGFGRQWHLSLHASGQWHLKEQGQRRVTWTRPNEVVPGYVRALGIVQPKSVVHRAEAAPANAILIPVHPEAEVLAFSLFVERPGANMNSWPGKNRGTAFIGRLPLAGAAGTCCVIAARTDLTPGQATFARPTIDELSEMREWPGTAPWFFTLIGSMSDGAIALLEMRVDRSLLAMLDNAE